MSIFCICFHGFFRHSDLAEFFEVERLCSWILANNFRRTALQLPDELLEFAFQLVAAVEQKLAMNNDNSSEEQRKLYVLADTSYRSCCLDEIAAEHIACDSIVHFGDACLSECGSRMPALYIFGRRPFELDTFVEQFRAEISDQIVIDQHWDEAVLICEAGYTHVQDSLEHSVASALPPSVQVHSFKVPMQKSLSNPSDANATELLGRQVPSGFDAEGLVKKPQRFLIFVGSPDNPLLPIAQMTIRHIGKTVVYCPETRKFHTSETSAHRMLLRRLYLIERLRDARTVGLVIGAVALRGCREAVARVRKLCERDGKRLYVMYIGKLNEAKLSNFGIDVDAFVLLSCPFGIIQDGTKFCRPILSVFEAEVALNPTKRDWLADMRWTPNFEQLAKDEIERRGAEDGADAIELVSLTSGNIRRHRSSDGEPDSGRNGGGQLLEYSAGNHFALRSWRGLEDNGSSGGACTDDEGTKCPCELKQGMDGIATRYVDEPSNSKPNTGKLKWMQLNNLNLRNPYFMFPFVLRNFLAENDWPPFRLWTDEYLAEKLAKGQCLTVRIGEKTHFRGQILHEHQCARHTFANCAAMLRWMRNEGHSDEGSEVPSPSSSICPNPSTHWAYLDYRDVLELLEQDEAERVDWTLLGVIPPAAEAAEKGEHWRDSTVWIGTPGAYTPCHFDTYGFNLHAQLRGHKRWLLFPPATDNNDNDAHNQQRLWPSRLPYEESSVFSALDIVGGDQRMDPDMPVWPLTIGPGDLLFVPPKWWHSVQCVKVKGENASDPEDNNSGCAAAVCISVNKWFPAPGDGRESAKEALLKFMMELFMGSGLLNAEEHLCPMECNSMESSDMDELAKLVEGRLENAVVNNEKNRQSPVGHFKRVGRETAQIFVGFVEPINRRWWKAAEFFLQKVFVPSKNRAY
ncbi:hypothetical protein GPALN_011389 [Globodera pallida]|nr:hypothetical protein GPALN_011389 [Globodera pallida]